MDISCFETRGCKVCGEGNGRGKGNGRNGEMPLQRWRKEEEEEEEGRNYGDGIVEMNTFTPCL